RSTISQSVCPRSCRHYVFPPVFLGLFFFNHTPPTEIYTLSLHDALPIFVLDFRGNTTTYAHALPPVADTPVFARYDSFYRLLAKDRKSTRLNSSHVKISYAVFCLKKKKHEKIDVTHTYKDTQEQYYPRCI